MMRYLLLLLTTFFMVGCFDESDSNPIASNDTIPVTNEINISGKVNLANAGGLDASSITVSLGDISVHPKDDGTYLLSGNLSKVAARSSGALDTVKIVVAGDTLIEIPVDSWNDILPTNYIVQRNVACVIPKNYAGSSVQAVFWDNDSIARVLNLGKGTTNYKFSGFIYTAYNDNQFKSNTKLYDIFARVKRNDSVVAYTEISAVSARLGNIDFEADQFNTIVNHIKYLYTIVPNDSSVKMYNDTINKKMVFDTIFDSVTIFGKNNSGWVVSNAACQRLSAAGWIDDDSTVDISEADSSFAKVDMILFRDTIHFKDIDTFESADSSVTCSTYTLFTFNSDTSYKNVIFELIDWSKYNPDTVTHKIVDIHVGKNYISTNNVETNFMLRATSNNNNVYSSLSNFKAFVVYMKIIKHYI